MVINLYDVLNEYIVPILNVSLQRLLISFVLLFAFFLFRKIIVKIIYGIANRFTSKTENTFDDDLLESFKKPLKFLITTIGIYIVLKYLNTSLIKEITLSRILRASIIGSIGWGLYNLEGAFTTINKFLGNKLNIQENSILYPLLSKFLRIITLLITFGTIAAEFDYPIDTFVTGLGISGLAIALATQDSLANIFGGVTLLIDKPFRIGDWISFGSIEALDKQISLSNRQNNNLTIIMFDIDNFKKVNDTFGHQIGDLVLTEIADLLTNKLRKSDIVGRYGGEEFLVILPDTDINGGFIIAEKIRKSVSKLCFEEAKGLNTAISGGAVQLKTHDALQLVKEADNLLYKAKHEGKNKICY